MAIDPDIPVWTFLANWDSEITEGLEFFTTILTSKNGSEQRRAHRRTPRRTIEFEVLVAGNERATVSNFITAYGTSLIYLPLWFDQCETSAAMTVMNELPIALDGNELLSAGDIVMVMSPGNHRNFELGLIQTVEANKLVLTSALATSWPKGSLVFRVMKSQFVEQPTVSNLSNRVDRMNVKFMIMETNKLYVTVDPAGPLITMKNYYVAHSYHDTTDPTGRTEDQFLMASACFGAYDVLRTEVGQAYEIASIYFLTLAKNLLGAIGDGVLRTPILRYPEYADTDKLNLPHYRFAARTGISVGQLVLEGSYYAEANSLIINDVHRRGNIVDNIWRIYPAGTSELFFDKPWSPAYDYENPTVDVSFKIETWLTDEDKVEIPLPTPDTPDWTDDWSVTYSYEATEAVNIGDAFKIHPVVAFVPNEQAVYAGDIAKFYEPALTRAIQFDVPNAAYWTALRSIFRKTDLKGRRIDDQRWIIEPMPGIDPIQPRTEQPYGYFCYSDHPSALTPGNTSQMDPDWSGINFWSRDTNGDLVAVVPNGGGTFRTQIGRAFPDQWRLASGQQPADTYLFIEVSCSKKPAVIDNEYFLVWVSAKSDGDDETARWFADIGSLPAFVATSASSGVVITFLIPIASFKKRIYNDSTGDTIWGDIMPAGQILKSFGISAEITGVYGMRLRSMRLISGADETSKVGYPMPYAPGVSPTLINLDMGQQRFYDENYSPLHGYQFPEIWKLAESEANAIFVGTGTNSLPVPNRITNEIEYPIASAGKTAAAMLMEQQLLFLSHAQQQYDADGGLLGPFAHTYTMNTYDRYAFDDSTPNQWVYENIRPYTQWGGFQYRIAEGLAQTIEVVGSAAEYSTAKTLASSLLTNFIGWLNVAWPDLSGNWAGFDGLRIYTGDESDYAHRLTGDENPFMEVYSE